MNNPYFYLQIDISLYLKTMELTFFYFQLLFHGLEISSNLINKIWRIVLCTSPFHIFTCSDDELVLTANTGTSARNSKHKSNC